LNQVSCNLLCEVP